MNKLFAFLPCYNEELNIGELIDKWYAQKDGLKECGYELIIVGIDDCSTDGTKKIIEEKSKQYDNCRLLPHLTNKGLCGGLNSSVNYFLENGKEGDLMSLMDGDNTHDPKYIHDMLGKLKEGNKDCVIASRYCGNSAVVGVAGHREFMSDMAKLYYSFVLRVPNVKDYTCGYRLYTYEIIRKLVDKYGEEPVVEKSFACMMELLYKLHTVGAAFDETGFELRYDNKQGQSKMHVLKTMRNSLVTAVKLKSGGFDQDRKPFKLSLITVISVLTLFTVLFLSSSHFFIGSDYFGHDASIFAYIGFAITKGRPLYTGAWDNKGPVLYLLNALGILIDHRFGILILEAVAVFITLFFMYKTANLFVSREISLVCSVMSTLSLLSTLEGGNMSEEYALPFTVVGFYFIAKYLKNDLKLKRIEMVVVGMMISAVFMLRLNILAYLACAVLGVIIILLKKKEYKKLGEVALFAFIGFLMVMIPVIIYLVSVGSLKACIDTAYLGVLGQFSDRTALEKASHVNAMLLELSKSGALYIAIVFIIYTLMRGKTAKKERDGFDSLCTISAFGLLATLLANSLSGAGHLHYFMSFIPVMIIPTVACAKIVMNLIDKNCAEKYRTDRTKNFVCFVLAFAVSASFLFNYLYVIYKQIGVTYTSTVQKVTAYICDNTDENDLIEVIGTETAISSYYASRRLAASNYFYYANGRFSDGAKTEFANKICDDVIKTHPKLVMFDLRESSGEKSKYEDFLEHCQHTEDFKRFLDDNYETVDNDMKFVIYKHK